MASLLTEGQGKYAAYDNVEDFVEHYLIRLAEDNANDGDTQMAHAIYHVLEHYLAGDVDVYLEDGVAYVRQIDDDDIAIEEDDMP